MKILIIDDDDFVRQSLSELLKSWRFEIAEAANSKEAFQQIKNNDFSGMLLDIRLGESNGLDILKTMRKKNINIPVIVMTGYAGEYDKDQFFDLDAVAFLTKPIQPATLKETLKVYVNT